MIRCLFRSVLGCAMLMPFMAAQSPASAQNCDYAHEVISTLRKPAIGSHNLWDTVYGDVNVREDIKALTGTSANDHVVMAAERLEGIAQGPELVLVEIDRRGRPVWQKRHKIPGLETVVTMVRDKERFIVLGNKGTQGKAQSAWIGIFDAAGEKVQDYDITEKGFSLTGTDILMSYEPDMLLLVAYKKDIGGVDAQASMLKWFDLKAGKVSRQVTFAIGADNQILNMVKHSKDQYFAAGAIREKNGRWSGWLANLNKDGGFIWQRPMSRGMGGRFNIIRPLNDDYVIVAGEAMPIGEDNKKAAWVAAVGAMSSEIAWQRYYRDSYNLRATGLETYADGQIAVLINASGSDNKDEFDFTRLLTLNPRGAVLGADGYYNGVGNGAFGFISGKHKERIIYGHTDVTYQVEKQDPDTKQKFTEALKNRQGWIVAGSAAEPYKDPCNKVMNTLQ